MKGPPSVLLAVNGSLMRGLELNKNLLAVEATFVRETTTKPAYRLWSIDDRHPAMVRVRIGGAAVAVEVWSVPAAGVAASLHCEPPGLSIGKVTLADGTEVLGVLGEPALCDGQQEITSFGGWRAYLASRPPRHRDQEELIAPVRRVTAAQPTRRTARRRRGR